jgi:hypothetical protein
VNNIRYEPPNERRESPASLTLTALSISFDSDDNYTKTWYTADISGRKTVPQILKEAGIHKETPEAYATYLDEVRCYNEIVDQLGKQYSGTGVAFDRHDSWWSGMLAMERDGVKARLVIDRRGDKTEKADGDFRRSASTLFWVQGSAKGREDDEEEGTIAIPVQP